MDKARYLENLSVDFSPVDGIEVDFLIQSLDENEYVWCFGTFGNGLNYLPHATSCTSMAVFTGNVLQTMMRPSISANRHISGKQVKAALTGSGSNITLANFPSKSSMYRHHNVIRNEDIWWYTQNWTSLEYYLDNLKAINDDFHVVLLKDTDNIFVHIFIGYQQNLRVIIKVGLDLCGIDSCHVRHLFAMGMQFHSLVSSPGVNHNVLHAYSLNANESSPSYNFFGPQCQNMEVMVTFILDSYLVPVNHVLFSNCLNGIDTAVKQLGKIIHHALCTLHCGE